MITRLEIAVKKQKNVGLSFNFVTDKAKRTTIKNPSDVPDWVRRLNEIFQPQTNVSFIHRSTRKVTVKFNLGPEVDSVDANFSDWEWNAVVKERDASAGINLFFVWKIAYHADQGASFPKGQNFLKDCLISDYLTKEPEKEFLVIAHEIGHALGIRDDQHFYHPDNKEKFVMYYISRFAGIELPKVHANTVNP